MVISSLASKNAAGTNGNVLPFPRRFEMPLIRELKKSAEWATTTAEQIEVDMLAVRSERHSVPDPDKMDVA